MLLITFWTSKRRISHREGCLLLALWRNLPWHVEVWLHQYFLKDTVLCHYNTINFLQNPQKRHPIACPLTHWGRATHICVDKLTIIGSDNGLSPGRRQAIIWTIAGILLIRTLGTNFIEILGKILSFSFSKMHLKMSSAKWRLFGLGLNELRRSMGCFWVFKFWYIYSFSPCRDVCSFM